MYAGNNGSHSGKSYFSGIDPTGILRGLNLVSINFVVATPGSGKKDRLDVEWFQASTGMTGTEYFNANSETDTETRISINCSRIEHFFTAFVPPVLSEEGKDIRWGLEEIRATTFKEFCDYFTSKVVIDPTVIFDLKKLYSPLKDKLSGLYTKPRGTIDPATSRKKHPFADYGKFPFISSRYSNNVLNVDKDLTNKAYPMFLECDFIELIAPPTNNVANTPNANVALSATSLKPENMAF
jgi:hypothetical protein